MPGSEDKANELRRLFSKRTSVSDGTQIDKEEKPFVSHESEAVAAKLRKKLVSGCLVKVETTTEDESHWRARFRITDPNGAVLMASTVDTHGKHLSEVVANILYSLPIYVKSHEGTHIKGQPPSPPGLCC